MLRTTSNESTPDLCDAYASGISVLEPLFTNFGGRECFYGEVVTVKCFEDNSKVKELAGTAGHNRIMVVDGDGSLRLALLGDMTGCQCTCQWLDWFCDLWLDS